MWRWRWKSRSKLGRAQLRGFEGMPQFEAEIPDPLCHHLPGFLPAGRVRTPTIGVLLSVFVCQYRLKGTTMQIQFDNIDSSKCLLGQVGEEELVDNARTRDAHRTLLFGGPIAWLPPPGTAPPQVPLVFGGNHRGYAPSDFAVRCWN